MFIIIIIGTYIGFHQKCHNPTIPASALQLDNPWICSYCQRGIKCPYLNESITVLQNWWSDDNGEESCNGIDSEDDNMILHKTGDKTKPKKVSVIPIFKEHFAFSLCVKLLLNALVNFLWLN